MKKLSIALLLLASPLAVASLSAYAAIACYDGAQGLIIGWAYNCESLPEADAGAIQACRNYGGLAPQVRLRGNGGWGLLLVAKLSTGGRFGALSLALSHESWR